MPDARLKIELILDDNGTIVGIKQVGDAADKAGRDIKDGFDKGSKSMLNMGASMQQIQGYITTLVGAAGLYKLIGVLKDTTAAASNLNEVSSQFGVVFKGQEEAAGRYAKVLVDSYAMSTRESKQYTASLQDLLKPMGVVPGVAAKMSFEIAKLSADLGSWKNIQTADVMNDITSALVGNYETMKKHGVVVNESAVKQEALNMGLIKGKEELDAARKAAAAYSLILKGTADAQGDMGRTSDQYANTLKQYNANVEELSATLGTALLPALTELFGWLGKVAKAWKEVVAPDMSQMVMDKMTGDLHAMQLDLAKFEGVAANKASSAVDAALGWLPGYITQDEANEGIRVLKARIQTLNQTIETEYAKMAAEHDKQIRAAGMQDPLKFTEDSFVNVAKGAKDAAAETKELKEYIEHVNNSLANLTQQSEEAWYAFNSGAGVAAQTLKELRESEQGWEADQGVPMFFGVTAAEAEANAKMVSDAYSTEWARSQSAMWSEAETQAEHFLDRMQDLFVDAFSSIRKTGIESFAGIFAAASGFVLDITDEMAGQMMRNLISGKPAGEGLQAFNFGGSSAYWNQPLFGGANNPNIAAGEAYGAPLSSGMTRGQGAGLAIQGAATIYDIYTRSEGTSKSTAAAGGALAGAASGAMMGYYASSYSGPYAAIGAAIGAIVGGISGYLGGADAPEKAKFRLGAGSTVNTRYPNVETPFGAFGFDQAKVIDTNRFKAVMAQVGEATASIADIMDSASIEKITAALAGWRSGSAKGDIEAAEFEEQFRNYFAKIGATWNTGFGAWMADFDGTLDDLIAGIQSHVEAIQWTTNILDPKHLTEYDQAAQDFIAQAEAMREALEATGGSAEELADWQAAYTQGLADIKDKYAEGFEAMKMQLGGMDASSVQLEMWAKKFGTTSTDVIANWDQIEAALQAMDFDAFNAAAGAAGMTLGDLVAAILGFADAAAAAAASMRAANETASFAAGSAAGAPYWQQAQKYFQDQYGISFTAQSAQDWYGLYQQNWQNTDLINQYAAQWGMTPEQLAGEFGRLGQAIESYEATLGQTSGSAWDLRDAIADTVGSIRNLGDAANTTYDQLMQMAEQQAQQWGGLGTSIGGTLNDLRFGPASQASAPERLTQMREWLGGMQGFDSYETAQSYYGGLQDYLRLAQEAYQRPSSQYQEQYAFVIAELTRLQEFAAAREEEQLTIIREQRDLLERIADNTAITAEAIGYMTRGGVYSTEQYLNSDRGRETIQRIAVGR